MTKTYEIKYEPVEVEGITYPQYNIYYFEDDIEVNKFYHSNDGVNGTVLDGYVNKSPNSFDKLKADKEFCSNLIDLFLVDNRDFPIAFTPKISMQMMQKFAPIKSLGEVGDIKSVRAILMSTTIDSVFTQERKDKYVLMCNQFLGL